MKTQKKVAPAQKSRNPPKVKPKLAVPEKRSSAEPQHEPRQSQTVPAAKNLSSKAIVKMLLDDDDDSVDLIIREERRKSAVLSSSDEDESVDLKIHEERHKDEDSAKPSTSKASLQTGKAKATKIENYFSCEISNETVISKQSNQEQEFEDSISRSKRNKSLV